MTGAPLPRSTPRVPRRRWIVIPAITGILLTAFVAWLRMDDGGAVRGGQTALVEQRTFAATATAVGTVKPRIGAEVRVGSRISGRVQRLRANVGDKVARGQIIAELETNDLDALVEEREAELRLAEAKLAALDRLAPGEVARAEWDVTRFEASSRLASAELDRVQSLLGDRVASAADAEAARERSQVANAQLESARRTLQLVRAGFEEQRKQAEAEQARAQAALRMAQVDRAFAVIRAPIEGIVASVATQEGETVAAGLSAPTFLTIIDLSRLLVHAYVDEVDIGKVAPGQTVSFTVDAFPARDFAGRVEAIYPSAIIQDNVVKYVVAVGIEGSFSDVLKPDMTANVRIRLAARVVLAVPVRAIRREGIESVVYVAGRGHPERRVVRVGWRDGQMVEVAAGLAAGERVLLNYSPAAPGGVR